MNKLLEFKDYKELTMLEKIVILLVGSALVFLLILDLLLRKIGVYEADDGLFEWL